MSDDEKPKWVDLFGIDPDWPVSVHERENHALRRMLTDLIEELRGLSGDGGTLFLVDEALDRAEERLREVTGDE